jgi:hypothetical protein
VSKEVEEVEDVDVMLVVDDVEEVDVLGSPRSDKDERWHQVS